MNIIISRFLGIATISSLALAVAPRAAYGQLPISITINVPVQVTDVDPKAISIRVHCFATATGVTGVTFDSHDYADVGPLVNGAVSGTANVVLNGTSTQAIAPGQQWHYQCRTQFLTATIGPDGYNVEGNPGAPGWTALAQSSGSNQVQGDFATQ